jgi:hypothetical protein
MNYVFIITVATLPFELEVFLSMVESSPSKSSGRSLAVCV